MTPITATTATGTKPAGLASVSINGNSYLYVANYTDGTMGQYLINGDGSLSPLDPKTAATASGW